MLKSVLAGLFLALAAILQPTPSNAATLIVDDNGELIGATGVNVGGILYDVAFVDGTCVALFDGCDQSSDFLFTDVSMASAAATALMDQVFIDDGQVFFDSNPLFTRGCDIVDCSVYVPYMTLSGEFGEAVAYNFPLEAIDDTFTGMRAATYDFSKDDGGIYAVFVLPGVPEPATWAMMLLGFGFIGFSLRHKNFNTRLRRSVSPY